MDKPDDRPIFDPRFEVSSVDEEGRETVAVYDVAQFAERAPGVAMGRRGFLKLALFAQAAGLAVLAAPPGRAAAQESKPESGWTAIAGVIIAVDYMADVAIIQEAGTTRHWCVKAVPARGAGRQAVGHFDQAVKPDDLAVFLMPRGSRAVPKPYPVASLGKVASVSKDGGTVCARATQKGSKACVRITPSTSADRAVLSAVARNLRPGSAAFFMEDFSIDSPDDLPVSLRVIQLKSGGVIRCEESWVEEDMIYYRSGYGTVALPIASVDISRSYRESVQVEVEEAYARQSLAIGRREEERARQAADEAEKALSREREAAKPPPDKKGRARSDETPPASTGMQKTQTRARYEDAKEKCGTVTETCSCVPVCY